MHDRLFARLGEQAVLRGSHPCNVNFEFGVAVNYEIGDDKYVQSEFAATVDIANIKKLDAPQVGDSLQRLDDDGVTPLQAYIIDAIAADNGFMVRCVLRDA